jgi:hypothetical protein
MNKVSIEETLHKVATGEWSIDKGCLEIETMHEESKIGQQSTIFDPVTHHERWEPDPKKREEQRRISDMQKIWETNEFKGSDFIKEVDGNRLEKQITVITRLMKDGMWRTLQEIESKLGYPQASISAQLRNLRKESFGGHTVDKKRRGKESKGLFEYRLRYYKDLEIVHTPKGWGTFIHYCEYDSHECTVYIDGVWISFDLKELTKQL